MKRLIAVLALAAVAAPLTGCAYGGVAALGADKVVVLRNDGFLFGALRKAYVCKASDKGLDACESNEAP